MKILEVILKVMMEDEDESITDSNNVTADAFSHASSSQRENLDAWLNTSAETLSAFVIDSSSSSIIIFKIASWIFTLDNGV